MTPADVIAKARAVMERPWEHPPMASISLARNALPALLDVLAQSRVVADMLCDDTVTGLLADERDRLHDAIDAALALLESEVRGE